MGDKYSRRTGTLTALQIARSMDALPCEGAPAKHAAGSPARTYLCTRAAADPAPLFIGDDARGTRGGRPALAVADHAGRGADARSWVRRGRGRETVRASEPAGVSVNARRHAVNGVGAVRIRRTLFDLQ